MKKSAYLFKKSDRRRKRNAWDLLYPPRCPFCDQILEPNETEALICGKCRKKLIYITKDYCMKCGKPLENEIQEYCEDCRKRKHFFDQGRALLTYQGDVKKSLYRYKNMNRREYARFYGEAFGKQFSAWFRQCRIDYLVPVPVHLKKKLERGYNQSEILAASISRATGVRMKANLLRKEKDTREQKTLNAAERRKNLQDAFSVSEILCGEHILLVDDIYTTGATADMAALALKAAGAGRVYVVCVAIGSLNS